MATKPKAKKTTKKSTKAKLGQHLSGVKKRTVKRTGVAAEKAKTLAVGEAPSTETPDRVTTDTVAKHRKEVLSESQRFIYPLTHSKHKVAIISSAIFVLIVALILGSTGLMLYRYQRTDDFAYRVSQIVPFPVARVDGEFVQYEDYLFEVRQNVHFYTTQESINFEDEEGRAILENVRVEALSRVKENVIAAKIARQNGISVSQEEVNQQIETIQRQGGIGDSEEALENTLSQYYNWTIDDFRSVIELQLLKQKLISILDTEATAKIGSIENRINDGEDFATLAEAESEDPFSRENGGQLGSVNRATTDFPPAFVEAAFNLQPDEVSGVIQTAVGLHIIKHLGEDTENPDQIKIAHILVQFKDVTQLLRDELANVAVTDYISLDAMLSDQGGQIIESQPQTDDVR